MRQCIVIAQVLFLSLYAAGNRRYLLGCNVYRYSLENNLKHRHSTQNVSLRLIFS